MEFARRPTLQIATKRKPVDSGDFDLAKFDFTVSNRKRDVLLPAKHSLPGASVSLAECRCFY